MNASEHSEKKGGDTWQQVISTIRHIEIPQNAWGVEQTSNANNAWYVNMSNGSLNNNNKNNAYMVFPVAEYIEELDIFFSSEAECFKNKRYRFDANGCHYHLAQIWSLIYKVLSGTYKPDVSTCFVLDYPVYREVFAGAYWDRVVHHIVAPYIMDIADRLHADNGDVSHGNRKGHSILTATAQIQQRLREHPNGYVARFDIQGFFMSLERTFVLRMFKYYESVYAPRCYSDRMRAIIRYLIHELVLSDPATNCRRNSPLEMWEHVAPNKSLFGNKGKGLPIGNYYSQILAVMALGILDAVLRTPHLVDDYCIIADTIEELHEQLSIANEVAQAMGLTIHPKKIYTQPVRHGVPFCGRFIYANRIYIGKRIIHAFKYKVVRYIRGEQSARRAARFMSSFNSYTGMMKHTASFNIQKHIMQMVLDTWLMEYVYFEARQNHIVCLLKDRYKPKNISLQEINEINYIIKRSNYGSNYYRSQRRLPKAPKIGY